jgi:energy-coupling factor transporter ATP-binding protein EcfA2
MSAILNAEDLVKRFGKTAAVDGLSFQVEQGSVYGLVGPNGAGKTTLIKVLMNIHTPTAGGAEVLGTQSRHLSARAAILAIGISILWLQYGVRKTSRSFGLAASAVVLGLGVLTLGPWDSVFAIQSQLSGPLQSSLQVEVEPAPSPASRGTLLSKGASVVLLPFRVTGLAKDVTLRCEGARFAIQAPSGASWTGQTSFNAPFRQTVDECEARIPANRFFLENHREESVRIHGTLSLTVFGNSRSTNLSPENPTAVPGVGQCLAQPRELEMPKDRDLRAFLCRAVLRWPRLLVTGHATDRVAGETFGVDLSYSPFPAELMISPVETNIGLVAAEAITITTQEPLAHVRVPFDAQNIRLGNLQAPTAR